MAEEEPPGGIGDPYITRIDGLIFRFVGVPGSLHRLYEGGGVKVLPRILPTPQGSPQESYFSGVDIEIGDVKVVALSDGWVHVLAHGYHWSVEVKSCTLDAPGHGGCTTEEPHAPHSLQGVPHVNVRCLAYPAERSEEAGLMVDGHADSDPVAYQVPE